MTEFRSVAKVADIAPGEMKLVRLDGKELVVANADGEFFAFGNVCTHLGGPLEEGELEGGTVTCPWHGAVFDIKTGQVVAEPAEDAIPTFEVRLFSDDIQVKIG